MTSNATPMPTPPTEILIVEDSRTQAELLRHLLETRGYAVTHAPDGRAALAAARLRRPALVIADVEMPVMDGHAMCRAIKDDPALASVPVVLLTGLSDPADVLRGLAAGADYYLTKPYERDYLADQVASILADPPAAAPSAGDPPAAPVDVALGGQRYRVTASRAQILSLLFSTYGGAVQRNQQLVRAERKLQEQNRQLEVSAKAEREAMSALKQAQTHLVQSEKLAGLGQMVAGVAHEINNPLAFVSNNMAVLQRDVAALVGLLDLYHQTEADLASAGPVLADLGRRIHDYGEQVDVSYTVPNLQDVLARSKEGLRRIQQIVKDLRDFARLDASDLSSVDLNAGIASVLHIIRTKANERQVRVDHEAGPVPPVTCYPAKVNQVVMNLVANAIDASPAGGVVTVRTASADGQAVVDVIDAGTGIDPAIRERIFDPFFTTKPIGQGTGLGLSISYGIVRDHGGRIDVESVLGRGTRFSVRLPLEPPAGTEPPR